MEADEEVESRRSSAGRRRGRKGKIVVSLNSLSDTAAERSLPAVGYFPSGYDPFRLDLPAPSVRAFQHAQRSNRLDLVVSDPSSGVEFVGRTYQGEAAATPQLCTYALGILNKDTHLLTIVPIAGNKILRLDPMVRKYTSTNFDSTQNVDEEVREIADLTNLYGTKKDKNKDSKWRSLKQQRNDPTESELLGNQLADAEENKESPSVAKSTTPRNIPPHDTTALTPEKAYPLDEIISMPERSHLSDILKLVEAEGEFSSSFTFWQKDDYPSFVSNRIHKLKQIKDIHDKALQACILSYITHLLKFLELPKHAHSSMSLRVGATSYHNIPHSVYLKYARLFLDPVSHAISSERKELLICYILVLTLHADNFQTDPSDVARDLKLSDQALRPYFMQLGCKDSAGLMTLSLPLNLEVVRKHKRRR